MAKSPTKRRSSTGSKAAKAQGSTRAKHASRDVEAVLSRHIEAQLQSLGQKQRVKADKWMRKMKVAVLNKVSNAASHAFDSSETLEQKQQRVSELQQQVKKLSQDLYSQVSERLQQAIQLEGAKTRSKRSAPKISFDEEVRALKSGFQEIARELQQMNTELQTRVNAMGELTQTVEQTLAQSEHNPAERGAAPSGPATTLDVLHSHLQRS